MKKQFVALAVAGAIAAPAMAQNAQLYGTFAITANQGDSATAKVTSVNSDEFQTSNLGIKVSEDLGGGMGAYVQLEGNMESSEGTAFGFDRQAHVGLKGGFGDIRVGLASTALDSVRGHGGSGLNIFDDQAISVGGKKTGTTRYSAPSFNGVNLTFSTTSANDGAENTVTATNAGSTEATLSTTIADVEIALGSGKGQVSNARATTNVVNVGFSVAGAAVQLQSIRNDENSTDKNWFSAGVIYPLGNGLTATVNYKTYDTTGANSDYKQMGVALSKALSKRTSIHAGYRSRDLDGTGNDLDLTAVGITHSF